VYRFLITLDEFEIIEKQINEAKLQPDIIDYFRGVITTNPWLTLAFAGLHTLQEMTEDYWNPLFGSVVSIPVSYLSEGATRRVLTTPSPDFAIDYETPALAEIYHLTFGQPYLIQLIGHHLITHLNEQIFESQVAREAHFTLADVTTIISQASFYQTGNAYFSGVWNQLEGNTQQAILGHLASEPTSLTAIAHALNQPISHLESHLTKLHRRDIIRPVFDDPNIWQFTVELMRRWVLNNFQF